MTTEDGAQFAVPGGPIPPAPAEEPELARQITSRLSAMENIIQGLANEMRDLRSQSTAQSSQPRGSQDRSPSPRLPPRTLGKGRGPQPQVYENKILSTGKPEIFHGDDEHWHSFRLIYKSYLATIDLRFCELLAKAADNTTAVTNFDLSVAEAELSVNIYYSLVMLLRGKAQNKVDLVDEGEGAQLWRLLMREYEPGYSSRTLKHYQQVLGFKLESADISVELDRFDKSVRLYQKQSGKQVSDETKFGVVLAALASSRDSAVSSVVEHTLLNAERITTYDQLRTEVLDAIGTRRFLSGGNVASVEQNWSTENWSAEAWSGEAWSGEISAFGPKGGKGKGGKGKGKDGKGKGNFSGQMTIQFQGECHHCGKWGHRKAECRSLNSTPSKQPKGGKKGKGGKGNESKPKCGFCNIPGHVEKDCRKKQAAQRQDADAGPSALKRKRVDEIADLRESLASLSLQCDLMAENAKKGVGSISLSSVELPSPSLSSVAGSSTGSKVKIGVDSGAEITVWPKNLYPQVETTPSMESQAGVKYWGPSDITSPSIADHGNRVYKLDVDGEIREIKVHVADVRKPLLAVCDLNDRGHDVMFRAARPGVPAKAWAQHVESGSITPFIRRGGRYELDAEVVLPSSSPNGRQAAQP